ncbi:MAG: uracil-xanthine permease [Ruminococcaceae bacterium]|nr:uracil-xanthine permease [Oscillospiraceae bacterium]
MAKNLVYDIHDKPKFSKLITFAIQQLLAIIAATIAVPAMVGYEMTASAALFGAGVGTLVYQLFTKFRSPVFLGSSFAFIGSMTAAFAGAASMSLGYLGLLIGALFAGLVYVIIAIIVKFVGVNWINKLMPTVVIGPTVALIGLSLSSAAIKDVFSYGPVTKNNEFIMTGNAWASFACAIVTFIVVILCSTYGKKMTKLIPFIIGVLSGYALALVLTVIGHVANIDAIKLIDFTHFTNLVANGVRVDTFVAIPEFSFIRAIDGIKDFNLGYLATIAVAYIPVAFVVFAEHIADHKNLSTIVDEDLLVNPGLHRTLLGDGVGSIAGAFFGGCPNTTYGESVGCVAITRNASVITITATSILAILVSFISPFVAFLDSIPGCIMGGVCITLYGFIAVSGLKMIQKVDFDDHANLFTVSAILISGVGGMAMSIGKVIITNIACALILGIIVNNLLNMFKKNKE